MKTVLFSRRAFVALALVLGMALLVSAAVFSARVNVSLSGVVTREGREVSLEDAGRVAPREVINWKIAAANVGDADANAINVVGDIDNGTTYVAGSAGGDGVVGVKFSLEHPHENQTFAVSPMVSYTENGVAKQRPARPDEYKAVQISFAKIGVGQTLRATYRTRVR